QPDRPGPVLDDRRPGRLRGRRRWSHPAQQTIANGPGPNSIPRARPMRIHAFRHRPRRNAHRPRSTPTRAKPPLPAISTAGMLGTPPVVLVLCHDERQRLAYIKTADKTIKGRIAEAGTPEAEWPYPARQNVVFACERDVHMGSFEVLALPELPP